MDIYQTVTDRILAQLKSGTVPWRKTWNIGLPRSLTTGKEYRGINILILGTTMHTSKYWVTYREAIRHGGYVRKGERATPVIYWKWRTPEEMQKQRAKTGRDDVAPCVPFVSAVFNLDQVEGVSRPEDDVPGDLDNSLATAAAVYEPMMDKPAIYHSQFHNPAYSRLTDHVLMPNRNQFENEAEYHATLFHELVHSTGHAKRLNRFKEADGEFEKRYSFKELVAEFGAAFLCGFAGIQNPGTEALQAGYIESWSEVFERDNRILLRAASAAQKAVDYIRGVSLDTKQPESAGETAIQPAAA